MLDCKENPSSFFFNKEKQNSLKKSVKKIIHNDMTHTKSDEILNCFRTFYQELYSEEPIDRTINEVFLNNLPQVGNIDNDMLSRPIDKQEILKVLSEMEFGKSPGSDGLTPNFYKKLFHLFGDELDFFFQLAYDVGEMSDSQKLSYITL